MSNWIDVNNAMPPPRTKCLFMDDKNKIWEGDMCYGMHAPWFCTHGPGGTPTIVLQDHGVVVKSWMLRTDAALLLSRGLVEVK